jgi:hypothetical protein
MNKAIDGRRFAPSTSSAFSPHFLAAAKLLAAAVVMLLSVISARAQTPDGRLRLDSIDRLATRAAKTVRVDVDGVLLKLGKSVLSDEDPEEKVVKEVIEGLRGVYVRVYEFNADGEFKEAELSELRAQLRAPAWTRLLDVQSRGVSFDGAEVYFLNGSGRVGGMAVVVAQPRRLVVVNVVGTIDLDKLKQLEGSFGIPRIHVGRGGKDKDSGKKD